MDVACRPSKTLPLSSSRAFLASASHFFSCSFPVPIASHLWTFKRDCRPAVPAFTHRVVGIRYQNAAPRSVLLQTLPSAAHTAVSAAWVHSQRWDRGDVHRKNDRTIDSRATHFAAWLGRVGYDDRTVRLISHTEASMLLEGYLHVLATEASSRLRSSKSTLQGSTLLLYLKAAALWLHTELGVTVHIVCPNTQKILPPFRDPIAQAFKWGSPQAKREPYTHQMLRTFYTQARDRVRQNPSQHLSRFVAVFDWIRLSLFMGSRGSEYCQTSTRRHSFSKVATDAAAGAHAGEPIAFILSDFRFLTDTELIVTPLDGLLNPALVKELQICFRFDKSPINGHWRKFRRTGHHYLCPVLAGLSIVQRYTQLRVPHNEPLGVYQWTPTTKCDRTYTFLRADEVIRIMRDLVTVAHPNPSHYLCQPDRLRCIDCHSARVTACVALSEGNATVEQIAHKLRWNVESVKHYMRDCSRTVGASTAKVIQGFFQI